MAGRVMLISAIAMVMMCHYVSAVFFPPPHPVIVPALTGFSPFPGFLPALGPGIGLPPSLLLAQQRLALRRRARSRSRSSSSSSSSSSNHFYSQVGATGPIPLAGNVILETRVSRVPSKSEPAFQVAYPPIINVVVPDNPIVLDTVPEIRPALDAKFTGEISDATIKLKTSDPASAIASINAGVTGSISDTDFIIENTGSGKDYSRNGDQHVQTVDNFAPAAFGVPAQSVVFADAGGATVGGGGGGGRAPLQSFQTFPGTLGGNFVQNSGSQTLHHSSSSSSSSSAASASASAASSLNDFRSSQAAKQGLDLLPLGAAPVPLGVAPVPLGKPGHILGR